MSPRVIGVVGAGTMGAGIAQLAALPAGARTLLFDPVEGTAERALERIRKSLRRGTERGRWSAQAAEAALGLIELAPDLEALGPCELVIEAAPERLDVKAELFTALAQITEAVLASNTSSIPITSIGGACGAADRVVGMHFFNPPAVMPLLEIVAGVQTGAAAVAMARDAGVQMGRRVIEVADGPGFLVNRCNRPFSLEAMRLVQERIASVNDVDRICRLGGGFPMGPFELMDLVGIDTGMAVAESFFAQSFGEPRWRPSPLAARMVAAGRHGRKSGRGWHDYRHGPHRPEDSGAPAGGGGDGLVVVAGEFAVANELRDAARHAGWDAREPAEAEGQLPVLALDCGAGEDDPPLQGAPLAVLCAQAPLADLDPGGTAVGFHALPPLRAGGVVELTRTSSTSPKAAATSERFFTSLGQHVLWVGDAPGLVLGRIVCQIVNESAFAVGEGVGSPVDVDTGMVLGMRHPRGPLEWADAIGLDHVLTVLDGLQEHYREERYRAAPLLRRLGAGGRLGVATGAGFHDDLTS